MVLEVVFEAPLVELDATFTVSDSFSSEFQEGESLDVEFGSTTKIDSENIDPYVGEYEVTPMLEEQTLDTAQKLMSADLQIKQIPIYAVSNNAGGTTVTIG